MALKSFGVISKRKTNCSSSRFWNEFLFFRNYGKDLGIFHTGTDFLFLFHLGKRKGNIGTGTKTFFKCEMAVKINSKEISLARINTHS